MTLLNFPCTLELLWNGFLFCSICRFVHRGWKGQGEVSWLHVSFQVSLFSFSFFLSFSKGRGEGASLSLFGPVGILLKCFLPSCLSWSYCWSDMENLVKQDFHFIAFAKYVMSDQWSLQGSEEGKALEMKCILGGISLLHPSIPLQSCGALNLNVRSRSYLLGTKRNRLKQGGTIKQTC